MKLYKTVYLQNFVSERLLGFGSSCEPFPGPMAVNTGLVKAHWSVGNRPVTVDIVSRYMDKPDVVAEVL